MERPSIDDLFDSMDVVEEYENCAMIVSTEETQSARSWSTNSVKRESEEDILDVVPNIKRLKCESANFDEFQNRITLHNIQSLESCSHEVACPPNEDYLHLVPNISERARTYPFELDSFQKESILCIDNNQSVLVSAHTSAGKTVVAEYAIALSLKKHQRVVYTTPIKALSNQKYREFCEEFKDVGLITGDVSINPNASCLVMTTEILRNMLYRGAECTRELGWIIFDEIHYMRNKERGVVWEESIILSPHNARFVFLSATIPNARQFAEWIAYLHQQPCHVVYSDYRPTPLQHFIFPAGSQGIHMIVDSSGTFKEDNYNTAVSPLQYAEENRSKQIVSKDAVQTDIFKIIKLIKNNDFSPGIVFSFSKKICETYAMLISSLNFNTNEEKELVDEVFRNAIDTLSEEDQNLPQVKMILPLLQKGIGVHHSGLLPILKETIEIMFGEGLIKILFATETFSMGLNMPARTVLFTSMRKFDGSVYRYITSGEYVQMSGRAGRRGIDSKGIVIMMMDEKIPSSLGREIIKGEADTLTSAFHLTYNMILNLLRVEDINPEYMLERSFFQFQSQALLPVQFDEYRQKLAEYRNFTFENEDSIASYYNLRQLLDTFTLEFRTFITKPNFLIPFLQSGRLVKVMVDKQEFDWGMIVNFRKVNQDTANPLEESTKIEVNVVLHVYFDINNNTAVRPCWRDQDGTAEVITVSSTMITNVSSVVVRFPDDLRLTENRMSILNTIAKVKYQFFGTVPELNPIDDMKIDDSEFLDIVNKKKNLEIKLHEHPMNENPMLQSIYSEYEKKIVCEKELDIAAKTLAGTKSVLQLDELKRRKRVLRRLGYCDNSDVIQLKGRVGCELSCSDEILLTEMIFDGIFGNLTPAQCCSLLSCFVCEEKSKTVLSNVVDLSGPLRQMQDLARKVAKVSKEAGMSLEEDAYVQQFKPTLMEVVYAWCNGVNFTDLCKMTDVFEGSIIRCMKRLSELLRQMAQASKTIGSNQLEEKFLEADRLIRRGIAFAGSLYF